MLIKHPLEDTASCPAARGQRLKSIRLMSGLSRNSLEHKYGISANTLQSWERAKSGGLTIKGASRVLNALRNEGIYCSSEWLLYGIGQPAHFQHSSGMLATELNPNLTMTLDSELRKIQEPHTIYQTQAAQIDNIHEEHQKIIQELRIFRKLNLNPMDYIVIDDGLSPLYKPGDYVAGKKRVGEAINHLIGMDCIIQTTTNDFLLRRILRRVRDGVFDLTCTNMDTSVKNYTLYDQEIASAAPVVWHRRPEALLFSHRIK